MQGEKVTKARHPQDFSDGEYPTTIKHNLIGCFSLNLIGKLIVKRYGTKGRSYTNNKVS